MVYLAIGYHARQATILLGGASGDAIQTQHDDVSGHRPARTPTDDLAARLEWRCGPGTVGWADSNDMHGVAQR